MEMLAMNEPEKQVQQALEQMPDTMAALMRQFIEKKDVDSRVNIKMRMKALLDFASVDTTYPANPLPDAKVGGGDRREGAAPHLYVGGGMLGQNPQDQPVQGGAGIPPRINNADIIQ